MRKFIITVLGLLLNAHLVFAQNENANLLVQSPDGKTVKLIWFIKSWDSNITGFDIKRKEGLGDWVKLNSEPILPGISVKNKIALVETDKTEASRIKAKLLQMIADNKLKEMNYNEYLQKLNSNDKEAYDILFMMAHDYDVALMGGFAFVDHSVISKTDYQYGLFIQGTNKLLASTSWNYGEIPDLNAVNEITSKASTRKKGIEIIWDADIDKMKSADVAGFNIYRQGIRLNQYPIVAANNDNLSEFTWVDKFANSSNTTSYSISAESIFGIEGIIKSYTYKPEAHTSEYIAPEAKEITSLGFYFKDGMSIKWSFPVAFEKFLKGFYVEKNNIPGGYKRVSPLLTPSSRVFIDKSGSPAASYISMRVVAVYNDRTITAGPGRIYSYLAVREPPTPQNLKVKSVQEEKKISVKLSWDPPLDGDTITSYYKLYVQEPETKRFKIINEKQPIRKNYCTYSIEHGNASAYKFYISAINRINVESASSDTVSIQVPSLELPSPIIRNVFQDGDKAVIKWEYDDIKDLKGFRLYQGKNLIAGEDDLPKDKREFITKELAKGSSYEYTIVAVSENNIESPVSKPAQLMIPAKNKR